MRGPISRRTILALAGASIVATGIVAGTAAAASVPARTDSQLVRPASSNGVTEFFLDDQIDDVWRAVTQNYPSPLPEGYRFSESAPDFFHPDDDKLHRFEKGLADLIAARYWRCAWLAEAAAQEKAGDSGRAEAATRQLESYGTLPSVSLLVDVSTYEKQMQEIADAMGTDPLTAEFVVDCEGVLK